MRMFKRVAIVATMAGLVAGPVAAASSASASTAGSSSQVRLTGGETTVTTAPGIATALLGNGIVPVATLPGTEGASIGGGGVAVKFTFPVTGVHQGVLTAEVNGSSKVRVPLLKLSLAHATIHKGWHSIMPGLRNQTTRSPSIRRSW
jgi:hypothetical protein